MEEEFEETDILFPEETNGFFDDEEFKKCFDNEPNRRDTEQIQRGVQSSSPINIPGRDRAVDGIAFRRNNDTRSVISSRIFVPPHIIMERRERKNMAFLVQPETQYATNERMVDGRGIPPIRLPMI